VIAAVFIPGADPEQFPAQRTSFVKSVSLSPFFFSSILPSFCLCSSSHFFLLSSSSSSLRPFSPTSNQSNIRFPDSIDILDPDAPTEAGNNTAFSQGLYEIRIFNSANPPSVRQGELVGRAFVNIRQALLAQGGAFTLPLFNDEDNNMNEVLKKSGSSVTVTATPEDPPVEIYDENTMDARSVFVCVCLSVSVCLSVCVSVCLSLFFSLSPSVSSSLSVPSFPVLS
jgi:hypothetical protein